MEKFESYLASLEQDFQPSRTRDAMFYSLLAGGKRVRPRLLFELLKGYGQSEEFGYPCAAAIEMIHTYSLIHDDLPAMDNDTLRRGRKTCHIAFDEATAILAGDALLTQAFQVVLRSTCTNDIKVGLVTLLSQYAGIDGMILGQTYDMEAEQAPMLSIEQLEEVHRHKTGKLLTLPLLCAALLSNHLEDIDLLKRIGDDIGLSFQIQDDIMDVIATQEELGKSTSDEKNHKVTYVSLLGIEQAQSLCDQYYERAIQMLDQIHADTIGLRTFLQKLMVRRN